MAEYLPELIQRMTAIRSGSHFASPFSRWKLSSCVTNCAALYVNRDFFEPFLKKTICAYDKTD